MIRVSPLINNHDISFTLSITHNHNNKTWNFNSSHHNIRFAASKLWKRRRRCRRGLIKELDTIRNGFIVMGTRRIIRRVARNPWRIRPITHSRSLLGRRGYKHKPHKNTTKATEDLHGWEVWFVKRLRLLLMRVTSYMYDEVVRLRSKHVLGGCNCLREMACYYGCHKGFI